MNLVKFQDTGSIHKNLMYFFLLSMKNWKMKFKKIIYSNITSHDILRAKLMTYAETFTIKTKKHY